MLSFRAQWAIPIIICTPPPPQLRNPFLMSVLPWNFRKFSCKIFPFPWNFLVKITLAHGISILNYYYYYYY